MSYRQILPEPDPCTLPKKCEINGCVDDLDTEITWAMTKMLTFYKAKDYARVKRIFLA